MVVRTRFAPSPTGTLHIGGARTAIFCYAYAKRHQGQFLLRIEDTDSERSTEASTQAILDAMSWLQLTPDEEIVYQTHRLDLYRNIANQLVDKNMAYHCHCSKERLEKLRDDQLQAKQKPRYDGHCRHKNLSHSDNSVIRFKNPEHGEVKFTDLIHGEITVNNSELDDVIIIRSDNMPTYNFTVVIDDMDMKITHVIRGDDHINNTPRQINILLALNGEQPLYAHAPMILGPDGKRLSKRHGAASVMEYEQDGILPEALINYLIRLGWSHGDQEIFSIAEICQWFDLADINKSAASINPEKLLWLNQHYMKTLDPAHFKQAVTKQFNEIGITHLEKPDISHIITLQRERSKTLKELADKSRYFYKDISQYDEAAIDKFIKPEVIPALQKALSLYEKLTPWEKDPIHQVIHQVAEEFELKLGKLAQPLRIAVTGSTVSPSIDETMFSIGQENCVTRLKTLLEKVA